VDVCEKRYVFNAEAPPNATPITRPLSAGPWAQQTNAAPALKFNATGRCPAYRIDPEIAAAVNEKRQRDEMRVAELVRRGAPVAPIRTGVDGGMHPTFLAKLKPAEIKDADGSVRMVVDDGSSKPLGAFVNPPRQPDASPETAMAATIRASGQPDTTASVPSQTAPAPRAGPALAATESRPAALTSPAPARNRAASGNLFTRLFSSDADAASSPQAAGNSGQPLAAPRPSSEDKRHANPAAAPKSAPRPAVAAVHADHHPSPKPAASAPAKNDAAQPAASTSAEAARPTAGLLNGASPVMPAGTFESRWGVFR